MTAQVPGFKEVSIGSTSGREKRQRIVDKFTHSDSSIGKESTCSVGDPSLIPGLRRYAGEGRSELTGLVTEQFLLPVVGTPNRLRGLLATP